MANQEHLDILKKGVETWNQWRKAHPEIRPDFRGFDFSVDYFSEVDLTGVNFSQADFFEANLSRANIYGANLSRANLSQVNLSQAILHQSRFTLAQCRSTDFSQADLGSAHVRFTDCSGANFSQTNLGFAFFNNCTLERTNMSQAKLGASTFADVDLSTVKALDTLIHVGPSTIGIDTIIRSRGMIPENFLRGAGVPDDIINYARVLINHPITYPTCFVSYSSRDEVFARQLYADLQNSGVRCWFAPEDLKIGDHYHQRIDESIRHYDKLILILSEQAVQSAWVEREMVAAREKEDREQRKVLFPIRLDDVVMGTTKAWAADVRRRWQIGNFTQWKHHDAYQQAFERLLRDLKNTDERQDQEIKQ